MLLGHGAGSVPASETGLSLLKRSPSLETPLKVVPDLDERDAFAGIRCPLCDWRPDDSSLWRCDPSHGPEPPFPGCGAVWNTFRTAGQCPGCSHQWKWTSCLSCHRWSLHADWYEDKRPIP